MTIVADAGGWMTWRARVTVWNAQLGAGFPPLVCPLPLPVASLPFTGSTK
jgi:hypothetical protein